jgi:hypothetical protein
VTFQKRRPENLEIWTKALKAPDYKTLQVARMEMVGNGCAAGQLYEVAGNPVC